MEFVGSTEAERSSWASVIQTHKHLLLHLCLLCLCERTRGAMVEICLQQDPCLQGTASVREDKAYLGEKIIRNMR